MHLTLVEARIAGSMMVILVVLSWSGRGFYFPSDGLKGAKEAMFIEQMEIVKPLWLINCGK